MVDYTVVYLALVHTNPKGSSLDLLNLDVGSAALVECTPAGLERTDHGILHGKRFLSGGWALSIRNTTRFLHALSVGDVTVPPSVGQPIVLAGASGQQNEADHAWFDDLLVIRLTIAARRTCGKRVR
jgi:hypothetical protein